jgi:DnaK suppressor protein
MAHNLDLQALRQELKESETLLLDRLNSTRDESEGQAGDDNKSNAGIFEDLRMQNSKFDRLDEERLEKIQAALHRLQQGIYGSCTKCGGEINPERLISLPYAELCIRCQRKEEQKLA